MANKATTPTQIENLHNLCDVKKVFVDVVACCYHFLLENKEAPASKIVKHLEEKFPLQNVIFVFDGELHQAKQATKAKRVFVQYRKKSKKVRHRINIVD